MEENKTELEMRKRILLANTKRTPSKPTMTTTTHRRMPSSVPIVAGKGVRARANTVGQGTIVASTKRVNRIRNYKRDTVTAIPGTKSQPVKPNECDNRKTDEPTTWDGLLSARTKSTSQTSVGTPQNLNLLQFDPCRILLFLTNELRSKLKIRLPADRNIRKILDEIHDAVKRIEKLSPRTEQSCASSGNLMQGNRVKICNSSSQTDKYPTRLYEKSIQPDEEQSWKDFIHFVTGEGFGCGIGSGVGAHQYNRSTTETPMNEHQHGDSSRTKDASVSLQNEKHGVQGELSKCRDEIAILKTELSCLKNQLKETANREACIIHKLEDRCKLLKNELKTLQDIVKKQTAELTIVQALSEKLRKSSEKINLLEKSRLENDKILAFTKLEKEKLAILQQFQEHQVDALQKEITEMCKLVRIEFEEMHTKRSSSGKNIYHAPPSTSSIKRNKSTNKVPANIAKPGKDTSDTTAAASTAAADQQYICHDDKSRISARAYDNGAGEIVESQKCHSAVKCSSSAYLKQQAYDLFRKNSIQQNNNFPEYGSTEMTKRSTLPRRESHLQQHHQLIPQKPHDQNMKAGNHRCHHSNPPLQLYCCNDCCPECQVKAQSCRLGEDQRQDDSHNRDAAPMHHHRDHHPYASYYHSPSYGPPRHRRSTSDFDFTNIYELSTPPTSSP